MGKFNEFRRRVAGKIVTYYYNRAYVRAVQEADARHETEGETMYVIDHFIKGRLLSVINRKEFRDIKHAAQKLHRDESYWSPRYGTEMLRDQCWYHTADRGGRNGLTQLDREARRVAFIRQGLKKARLY